MGYGTIKQMKNKKQKRRKKDGVRIRPFWDINNSDC